MSHNYKHKEDKMKKYLVRSLCAAGVIAGIATEGHAIKIRNANGVSQTPVSQAQVDAMSTAGTLSAFLQRGGKVLPGVYLYVNDPGTNGGFGGSRSGYIYIGSTGNSIYDFYMGGVAEDQHSTVVTEAQATRASTKMITDIISARIGERTGEGAAAGSSYNLFSMGGNSGSKGGNAGACEHKLGVWARAGWTHITDNTIGGKWNANLYTLLLGADYKFNERFLAGLALTYGFMNGTTSFNQGKIKGDNAFGVAPYANFKATNWLNFDALVGYARVNKSRNRLALAGGPNNAPAVKVSGKPTSNRWYAAITGNLVKDIQKWALLLRVGYLYAKDKQGTFTESNGDQYSSQNVTVSQLFVRPQVGFRINECVTPYLFAFYAHDFQVTTIGLAPEAASAGNYQNPEQHRGSNWIGGGAGLNFVKGRSWSGGLEYGYKQAQRLRTHDVALKLRYQF
jgi:hypothetical protein